MIQWSTEEDSRSDIGLPCNQTAEHGPRSVALLRKQFHGARSTETALRGCFRDLSVARSRATPAGPAAEMHFHIRRKWISPFARFSLTLSTPRTVAADRGVPGRRAWRLEAAVLRLCAVPRSRLIRL